MILDIYEASTSTTGAHLSTRFTPGAVWTGEFTIQFAWRTPSPTASTHWITTISSTALAHRSAVFAEESIGTRLITEQSVPSGRAETGTADMVAGSAVRTLTGAAAVQAVQANATF